MLDGLHLPVAVHHSAELMLFNQRQLISSKKAFEQQNWLANTRSAQLQRFFDASHGKAIGVAERFSTHHCAMPIGIGLDHRQGAPAA